MGYKKAADGVTESGKTKGKNLGDDGKKVTIESGKSFGERVDAIKEKLNQQNNTEKQALLLKKQLLDLELSRGFEFVGKFQEADPL